MDYYPTTIYTKEPKFWPVIDDALRRAAIERGIEVKLLLSNWTSTRPQMKDYLRSLTDLSRYESLSTQIKYHIRIFNNLLILKMPSISLRSFLGQVKR